MAIVHLRSQKSLRPRLKVRRKEAAEMFTPLEFTNRPFRSFDTIISTEDGSTPNQRSIPFNWRCSRFSTAGSNSQSRDKKKHAIMLVAPGNLSGESLCKRGPYACSKALVQGGVLCCRKRGERLFVYHLNAEQVYPLLAIRRVLLMFR